MENELSSFADRLAVEVRKPIAQDCNGTPFLLLPKGDGWEVKDMSETIPTPVRPKGTVTMHDLASFIAICKRFGVVEGSMIYCDADYSASTVTLRAVFDDHESALDAGHRQHRAVYSPRQSEEWKRWTGNNGAHKAMGQVEFALFLEENAKDITTADGYPSGAAMLAMALTLEATGEKRLRSGIRLQSGGVQLEYIDKEDEATVQKMQVFEKFRLGIPPFFRGQGYALDARLRYRVGNGAAKFWYELIRPDLVLAAAVDDEIAKIRTETGLPLVFGTP